MGGMDRWTCPKCGRVVKALDVCPQCGYEIEYRPSRLGVVGILIALIVIGIIIFAIRYILR